MTDTPAPKTTEQKLDVIVEHLENMDRRDRLRTWGAFFRSLISMIPIVLLLWSVWYTYQHGAELLEMISKEAAKQAAEATKQSAGDLQEQLRQMLPK